jgi:hypothetical protein
MDDHDGGHPSDAGHVHDVGDASSTADSTTDIGFDDARCGDATSDVRDDRPCDRD